MCVYVVGSEGGTNKEMVGLSDIHKSKIGCKLYKIHSSYRTRYA